MMKGGGYFICLKREKWGVLVFDKFHIPIREPNKRSSYKCNFRDQQPSDAICIQDTGNDDQDRDYILERHVCGPRCEAFVILTLKCGSWGEHVQRPETQQPMMYWKHFLSEVKKFSRK